MEGTLEPPLPGAGRLLENIIRRSAADTEETLPSMVRAGGASVIWPPCVEAGK